MSAPGCPGPEPGPRPQEPVGACTACLTRSALVTALAGRLEVAWKRRRGALRDVLALANDELATALGVPSAAIELARWPSLTAAEIRRRAEREAIRPVCRHDARYPSRLLESADAPAVLYVAGDCSRLDAWLGEDEHGERRPTVSIVGTRRSSPEGLEVARQLARGVAAAGVPVVSGMAMGIDSAAHRGALASGGPTVAVLACGPDVAYPVHEAVLHRELRDAGLVVSEFPPGTQPRRWAFPARNRIIAGLGSLTIVVEAATRSGSLITAEFAMGLGRDVAAVPGRAGSPSTRGSNGLLREGAAVVLDAEDVLDLLLGTDRGRGDDAAAGAGLDARLRALLADVARGYVTVPALMSVGHDIDEVLDGLAELELGGLVRRAPGGVVVPVAGVE